MKTVLRLVCGSLALLAGFVGGNVLAQTGPRSLKFVKLTLAGALGQVHRRAGVNVIAVAKKSAPQSFTVSDASTPEQWARAVGKRYGADAVSVGGVYVMEPAIGSPENAVGKLASVEEWLSGQVQSSESARKDDRVNGLGLYVKRVEAEADEMVGLVGAGTYRFGDLPPEAQQRILDRMRAQQVAGPCGWLDSLLQRYHPAFNGRLDVPRSKQPQYLPGGHPDKPKAP